MARVAKLLRKVPELTVLAKAVAIAARAVVSTVVLLFTLAYVFSIVVRYLALGTPTEDLYFKSVPFGMKMLFLWSAMPDIVHYVNELGSHNLVVSFLVVTFVMIVGMALLNMLIGVLCEVIGTVSTVEKEFTKVISKFLLLNLGFRN